MDTPGTRPAGGRPGWNFGHVVGCLVAGLVGSVLMVSIGQALGGTAIATATEPADLWMLALSQVGLWAGLLGGPLVVSRRLGSGSLAEDFGLRFRARDVPWALLGPALQVAISVAYSPFVSDDDVGKVARELAGRADGSPVQFAMIVLATVVGAPVVEELFFRGMFLRLLRWRLGAVGSVIVCGIVFGLFHFEALQLPALAVFGMVTAILALRTGRLGPSVWLHVGFNASTMAVLAFEMF